MRYLRKTSILLSLVCPLFLVACPDDDDPVDPPPVADEEGEEDGESTSTPGQPGTACGFDVFASPTGLPDSTGEVVGPNGLLVTNLGTNHPYVTPNGDGRRDSTTFTTDAFVDGALQDDAFTYDVHYRYEVLSAQTCEEVPVGLAGGGPVKFEEGVASVDAFEDFEGLPAGTILEDQLEGVTVSCTGARSNWPDACVLFDSEARGVRRGLRTDDQGNVVVIAKKLKDRNGDGLVDRPDTAPRGGEASFSFDDPVTLNSVGLLDVERHEPAHLIVTALGGDETRIDVEGKRIGTLQTVDVGLENVVSVTVSLSGSGAITHLDYATEGPSLGEGFATFLEDWDVTDVDGTQVGDGGYLYRVIVDLVRSDGVVVDAVESPYLGLLVDSSFADFDTGVALSSCDPASDPDECQCPAGDASCTFVEFSSLIDLRADPAAASDFISTTVDPSTGRTRVVADVTEFNGGGIVPKSDGQWDDADELRFFVSELTGVPSSGDERLINFDFVQIGEVTGYEDGELLSFGFNNLILDLITDADGNLTVGSNTVNVSEYLNLPVMAPEAYLIGDSRENQECTRSGGFNGSTSVASNGCVYAEAIEFDPLTELGLYVLRSSVFGVEQDGMPAVYREVSCDGTCAARTFQQDVEVSFESVYYVEGFDGSEAAFTFEDVFVGPSVTRLIDRSFGSQILTGECTRSFVVASDLLIRLDAADGSVSETCIINGIFD